MTTPKMTRVCICLFCSCLFLVGCGRDQEKVIAEVNGSKLTWEDLYAEIPPDYFDSVTQEQKKQFVERWINAEVLYQEALRRGLQRDPQTREKIRSAEKNILIADLIQVELNARAQVSEEEADQFYQAHLDEFARKSAEIKASQILIPTLEEANRIWKQLEEGADFAQLARERSLDPSATKGGDLGYFSQDDVLSEVAKAALTTPPGALTKPVKTEFGYHILLVTDVQEAGSIRPFDLVKEEIIGQLSREKERQELDAFLQELREASSIKQDQSIFDTTFGADGQDSSEQQRLD